MMMTTTTIPTLAYDATNGTNGMMMMPPTGAYLTWCIASYWSYMNSMHHNSVIASHLNQMSAGPLLMVGPSITSPLPSSVSSSSVVSLSSIASTLPPAPGLGDLMHAISLSMAKEAPLLSSSLLGAALPSSSSSLIASSLSSSVLSPNELLEPSVASSRKRKANSSNKGSHTTKHDKPSSPIDYASRRSHSNTPGAVTSHDHIRGITIDSSISMMINAPVSPSGGSHSSNGNTSDDGSSSSTDSNMMMVAVTHAPPQKRPRKATTTDAASRVFPCGECNFEFKKKDHLKRHQQLHEGTKPFDCKECPQTFARKDYLKKHQKIHLREKPFICEFDACGKTFPQKSHLTVHRRTHTGVKPFKCNYCSKDFTRKDYVVEHERVHTGEKPFSCGECGSKFTQRGTLRTHQRIHNSTATTTSSPSQSSMSSDGINCPELTCGKQFSQKSELDIHMTVHTSRTQFNGMTTSTRVPDAITSSSSSSAMYGNPINLVNPCIPSSSSSSSSSSLPSLPSSPTSVPLHVPGCCADDVNDPLPPFIPPLLPDGVLPPMVKPECCQAAHVNAISCHASEPCTPSSLPLSSLSSSSLVSSSMPSLSSSCYPCTSSSCDISPCTKIESSSSLSSSYMVTPTIVPLAQAVAAAARAASLWSPSLPQSSVTMDTSSLPSSTSSCCDGSSMTACAGTNDVSNTNGSDVAAVASNASTATARSSIAALAQMQANMSMNASCIAMSLHDAFMAVRMLPPVSILPTPLSSSSAIMTPPIIAADIAVAAAAAGISSELPSVTSGACCDVAHQ